MLEKSWAEGMTEAEAVRLAVKSLLEVVDSGSKNMEVAVLRRGAPAVVRIIFRLIDAIELSQMMREEELIAIIADIEREAEEAKQKSGQETASMSI